MTAACRFSGYWVLSTGYFSIPSIPFSSHFSRTLITDPHPNRGEDTSTVHHRVLRQPPLTNSSPAVNFPQLFDNIWQRRAPPQVHAKSQNLPLSPIFLILCL